MAVTRITSRWLSCLFFHKNLRGIVRQAKPRNPANSVATEKSKSREEADSSSRILHQNCITHFSFLLLPLTTEAMGIWRFAGAFPVVQRQKEMRAQMPLNARQPANDNRRVLGVCSFVFSSRVIFT